MDFGNLFASLFSERSDKTDDDPVEKSKREENASKSVPGMNDGYKKSPARRAMRKSWEQYKGNGNIR